MNEKEITEKFNSVIKILEGLSYADALKVLSFTKNTLETISIVSLCQE